jgi:photosystem II stability/assembly factor-like uncharacterized protein
MKRLVLFFTLALASLLPCAVAHAAGWVAQDSGLSQDAAIRLVSFGDALHGCAIAEAPYGTGTTYGIVVTTADGGATWVRRADIDYYGSPNVGHPSSPLYGLHMVDAARGWLVGYTATGLGVVYATTDGGATWVLNVITPHGLWAVDFPDKEHGWVAGAGGALYSTSDGGASWHDLSSGQPSWDVFGMDFVDALHGCLVGYDSTTPPLVGRVRMTADGCLTWLPWATRSFNWFERDVALRDASHGLVVGDGGQILAIEGDNIYSRVSGTPYPLDAVAYGDAQHAHVVGNAGTILASSDAGATWHAEQSPTEWPLYDVCFLGERHGWAVGHTPSILAYDPAAPITTAAGADSLWHNATQTVRLTSADDPNTSGKAGVYSITTQMNGAAPVVTLGTTVNVTVAADPVHHSTDGVSTISYYATDKVGNVEAAQTVNVRIDTRRPQTAALARASVRRHRTALLKYIVNDRAPNGGNASVTIRIRTLKGKLVRTLEQGARSVNLLLKAKFTCTLHKGTYRYFVYATDLAGNKQSSVGVNKLVVK